MIIIEPGMTGRKMTHCTPAQTLLYSIFTFINKFVFKNKCLILEVANTLGAAYNEFGYNEQPDYNEQLSLHQNH